MVVVAVASYPVLTVCFHSKSSFKYVYKKNNGGFIIWVRTKRIGKDNEYTNNKSLVIICHRKNKNFSKKI